MMETRVVYYCNYSIGENVYDDVAKVCGVYGKKALLIGGKLAMEAALPRLREKLAGSGLGSQRPIN